MPCCVRLLFPITRSTKQCHDAALNLTRQPQSTNERQILSTTTKLRLFLDGSRSLIISFSKDSPLGIIFKLLIIYVGVEDKYQWTPSQSYRSHNRILWPLSKIVAYNAYRYTSKPTHCGPQLRGIDRHNCPTYCWPNSLLDRVYCPGYNKKPNVTQAYRCRTL